MADGVVKTHLGVAYSKTYIESFAITFILVDWGGRNDWNGRHIRLKSCQTGDKEAFVGLQLLQVACKQGKTNLMNFVSNDEIA